MRNFCLVFLSTVICCLGCQQQPSTVQSSQNTTANLAATQTEQVRGLFTLAQGQMWLVRPQARDTIQIVDQTNSLDTLFRGMTAPFKSLATRVGAALTGRFKNLEGGARKFEVTKVDSLLPKNPETLAWLGIPFEFWCHGNEPFWQIEISKAQGAIFYDNISQELGWENPWVEPKISGNTYVYTLPERVKGTYPITLVIKKESCNDGMSDLTYNYSATLKIAGNVFHGVAISGDEPPIKEQ